MNNIDEIYKEETLTEKLVKKGFILYFFTFLIAPTGYVIRVLISSDLSVSDVGLIYSIISFITLISVYNDLGLTQSLKYFLPKYRINKEYSNFKTVIFLSLLVQILTGLFISGLLFFGSDFLGKYYFQNDYAGSILKLFCFYFLGLNLYQVISTIFSSFQDVFYEKIIELIKLRGISIFSLLFFLFGNGSLFNYSLSWVIGLFISVIVGFYLFNKKYKKIILPKGKIVFEKNMLKDFFSYSFRTFLSLNSATLLGQIDQQMIVYFLGTQSAGYYSNYQSLLLLLTLVVGPVLSVLLFPITAELVNKKNYQKIGLLLNFFYKYFSVFALSFGVYLMVFGEQIALVFFGEKFIYSGSLLFFSGIFLVFVILYSINVPILGALGKVKQISKIVAFSAVLNILMNYFLINFFGLIGAIYSTIVLWFVLRKLTYNIISKIETISINYKFLIKNILIYSILGLFMFFFIKNLFVNTNDFRLINLFYLIVVGIIYYIIIGIFNYKELMILKKQIGELKNLNN